MRIYDLLFYASYKLAQKSGNFDDAPILGGLVFVVVSFSANLLSIYFILHRFNLMTINFPKQRYTPGTILFTVSMMLFLFFYYKYKNRYKRIVSKYENKKLLNSWWIVIIYSITSGAIMIISGMFMNKDWIFG